MDSKVAMWMCTLRKSGGNNTHVGRGLTKHWFPVRIECELDGVAADTPSRSLHQVVVEHGVENATNLGWGYG